jgi:hypothetical protein
MDFIFSPTSLHFLSFAQCGPFLAWPTNHSGFFLFAQLRGSSHNPLEAISCVLSPSWLHFPWDWTFNPFAPSLCVPGTFGSPRSQCLRPIILATWMLRSGESRFKTKLSKQFLRSYLQNNQRKMDWRSGSSGTAPVLQAWRMKPWVQTPVLPKKKKRGPGRGKARLLSNL